MPLTRTLASRRVSAESCSAVRGAHPRSCPSTRGRTRLCPLPVRIICAQQGATKELGGSYKGTREEAFKADPAGKEMAQTVNIRRS